MTTRLGPGLLALAAMVCSAPARAQNARPEVVASASSRQVEVGESFTVELKALSDQGETTTDPQLRPPTGFEISGPRVSTQTLAQFGGGRSTVKSGLGATWTLVATTPGTFTIPAPSVLWAGQRIAAAPMTIEVTPASGGRSRSNPFLLPGGPPLGWPFGPAPRPPADPLDDPDVPAERELSLPTPRLPHLLALPRKDRPSWRACPAIFYIYARTIRGAGGTTPRWPTSRVPCRRTRHRPAAYVIAAGPFTCACSIECALPLRAGELRPSSSARASPAVHLCGRVRESNVLHPGTGPPPTGFCRLLDRPTQLPSGSGVRSASTRADAVR